MQFGFFNQFAGVIGRASNVVGENVTKYTSEMFFEDFPQFTKAETDSNGNVTRVSLIPPNMLETFLKMANSAIQENRWFEKWRYAMGLYIAHYATLYLRSFSESSQTPTEAANSGALLGLTKSASLGDASVSYDNSAIVAATEKWGTWNSTQYGAQLVTEARLVSMGGSLVI